MSKEKELELEAQTVSLSPESVINFHLPTYNEIPNVGLYLKQVVKLINDALEPAFQITVTETMLSNYVKKHIVSSPVKKQYNREQIATLIFVVLAKTVLSLDNIQKFLMLENEAYLPEVAYDYFCAEFENVLQYVYGYKQEMDFIGRHESKEKELLRCLIITAAHKFHLDSCFEKLQVE